MRGRRGTRGGTRVAGLGVALVVLAGAGAPAMASPDPTTTVVGTVGYLTVDGEGEGGSGAPGTGLPLVPVLDVDGALYAVPDEVIPDVVAGTPVSITVAAGSDADVTAALEELAGEPATPPGASPVSVEVLEPEAPAAGAARVAEGAALGTHTLTVLPVAWPGNGPDGTSTSALQALAASTGRYWSEQTGGRLTIPAADVRGWATIDAPPDCSQGSAISVLEAAMQKHGVSAPGGTQHVVVYFPYFPACGWDGMASIGEGGGVIWLNGTLVEDVLAHELGHNLGLGHANLVTCGPSGSRVPLTEGLAGCTGAEYEDLADVMGFGLNGTASGNLNVGLADALGLAVLTDTGALAPGTTTLAVAPLAQVGGHRGTRTVLADGVRLYAEYRPAAGRDVRRPAWAGVQVRLVLDDESGAPSSYLLDLGPSTGSFTAPALAVGRSFAVPGSTVSLTTAATSATGAQLVVTTLGTPDQRYVRRVYLDLMGRAVDPSGLATWTNALAAGTPRIEVANSITYSDEYRMNLIRASYTAYLGRTPDPSGLAHWLGAMRAGITIQQMEAGFLGSLESYLRAGGTDAAWVTQLYGQVLGRAPGASEVAHWTTVLAAGASRGDVAMGFTLSTEHLTALLDGTYRHLLGRGIDPSGAATWVGAIQSGARYEAVIGGVISSEEYYSAS